MAPRFLGFFTLLLLCLSATSLAAQTNIAGNASVTTSYVSSWETLSAVNDGYEPSSSGDKSHGAYGNWQQNVTNKWNWVQYTFSSYYKISRSDVYWWTDGGGIALPYDCKLEYLDSGSKTWKSVPNPNGLGVKGDQYNTTTFDTILTKQIRISFVSTAAQGILEWKVFGETGEQLPEGSVSYAASLVKGDTTTIRVYARQSISKPIEGYQFKLDVTINNAVSLTDEVYKINGQTLTSSVKGLLLNPTDSKGLTTLEIILPPTIDPTDGLSATVLFNEGTVALRTYTYNEQGKTPPALKNDTSQNTVDNELEITFEDNEDWRNHLYKVLVNNQTLDTAFYRVEPGKLILTPAQGNPLATTGTKTLRVEATGYAMAQVYQPIKAGRIDPAQSTFTAPLKLFKNAVVTFTLQTKDRFGNVLPCEACWWDGLVSNTPSTDKESYTVNDTTFNESVYGKTLPLTDANGQTTIKIKIPASLNTNDGLTVRIRTIDSTFLLDTAYYICTTTEKRIYVDNQVRQNEWSYDKSVQSDNFIIFWGAKVGTTPLNPANGDQNLAFDPVDMLNKLEYYLSLYVDTFGFITNKHTGNMATYKFPIVITDTWTTAYPGGYANGGSTDGVIGSMWVHPSATKGSGFVIAHEFAHMCQAMIPIQYSGKGIKDPNDNSYALGMFWESHANFMAFTATGDIARAYPQRFLNTTMLHFSSTSHYYENNFFLQYLLDDYSMETINKIWRNANQGQHPLMSLRANEGWSQDRLNDEFGKYAQRNVTWDYSIHDNMMKVINGLNEAEICRQYTYVDTTNLNPGWYIVPKYMAPADYGYNLIPLYREAGASQLSLQFQGYPNTSAGGAGWRYGFVAVDAEGKPRYSPLGSLITGNLTFDLTDDDKALYLVVTGAPATHHNYIWTPGWPRIFRYPYRFALTGAKPAGQSPGYNSMKDVYAGKPHPNGGGWVANTANVAATAYVGPYAQVLENATVSGNARIDGHAIVKGSAIVSGNAIVRDNAIVGSSAKVRENAVVEQAARIFYNSDIFGSARIQGSPIVYSSAVSGSAIIKDLAWLDGATVSGTAIIGGDAEDFKTISAGTYFQDYGVRNGDGLTSHYLNNDINPSIDEYTGLTPVNTTMEGFDYSVDKTNRCLLLRSRKPATVTCYTLAGQVVVSLKVEGEAVLPFTGSRETGVYLIKVETATGTACFKVML